MQSGGVVGAQAAWGCLRLGGFMWVVIISRVQGLEYLVQSSWFMGRYKG